MSLHKFAKPLKKKKKKAQKIAVPVTVVAPHVAVQLTEEQLDIASRLSKIDTGHITMGGLAGTGKAQPDDAIVKTPFGDRKISDITVGSVLYNPSGGQQKVIGVYPQGEKQVYEIIFADGRKTRACGEHLWLIRKSGKKYKSDRYCGLPHFGSSGSEIVTTDGLRQCLESNNRFKRIRHPIVPLTLPVEPASGVRSRPPLDPYLLGVLLGDGCLCLSPFRLTTADSDIIDYVKDVLGDDSVRQVKGSSIDYYVKSAYLRKTIASLGLNGTRSGNKFVPKCYFQLSSDHRFSLLQGLMDTDGTAEQKGGCSYSSTSAQLATDVQNLVWSLGGKASISSKTGKYKKDGQVIECQRVYTVFINIADKTRLFRLKRKSNLVTKAFNGGCSDLGLRVVAVNPVGIFPCRCIKVDHPNGLYLTNDYIVTHNTTVIAYLMRKMKGWACCAFTGKAADVLRSKGVDATTIHSLIYYPLGETEDGLSFVKKPYLEYCGIIVDEASMVGKVLFDDIMSFGLPVIFVGDHGQLEPVGEGLNLMKHPDCKLETIHRNAGDIAKFAHYLRDGGDAKAFESNESVSILRNVDSYQHLENVDQVICAFNNTRVSINKYIRQLKKYDWNPVIGDRVISLRNNRRLGIYNGSQGVINDISETKLTVDISGTLVRAKYSFDTFNQEKQPFGDKHVHPFDYAYCVTCHKAQGSEWDRILVVEQKCDLWDHKRWAYTAASRAKTKLLWVVS